MNAGCYLRYSTSKFYSNTVNPKSPWQIRSYLVVTLGVVLSTLALVMIVIGACFGGKRLVENYREKNQLRKLLSTMNKSKFHFFTRFLKTQQTSFMIRINLVKEDLDPFTRVDYARGPKLQSRGFSSTQGNGLIISSMRSILSAASTMETLSSF